jgi:hypothetical protein
LNIARPEIFPAGPARRCALFLINRAKIENDQEVSEMNAGCCGVSGWVQRVTVRLAAKIEGRGDLH